MGPVLEERLRLRLNTLARERDELDADVRAAAEDPARVFQNQRAEDTKLALETVDHLVRETEALMASGDGIRSTAALAVATEAFRDVQGFWARGEGCVN